MALVMNWIGQSGDWSDPANWRPHRIPVPGADLVVTGATAPILVTHSVDTPDIARSLTFTRANFAITGGSVTIYRASSIGGDLTITGANLSGAATLSVQGAVTLTRAGVEASASLVALGGLAIAGGFHLGGGRLVNGGSGLWTDGPIFLGSSSGSGQSALINAAGATLVDQTTGGWVTDFSQNANLPHRASLFLNRGTYRKTGSGQTVFDVLVQNDGVFDVQSGSAAVNIINENAGSFVGAGTVVFDLKFQNSYAAQIDGVFTAAGLVDNGEALLFKSAVAAKTVDIGRSATGQLAGGHFTATGAAIFAAAYAAGTTTIRPGGAVEFQATAETATLVAVGAAYKEYAVGRYLLADAAVKIDGALTVTRSAVLNKADLTGTGALIGRGEIDVRGPTTLAATTLIDNYGLLAIDGGGAITVLAKAVAGAVAIHNEAGATIDDRVDTRIGPDAAAGGKVVGQLVNDGVFEKTGAGVTTITLAFVNNGTLEVKSGTLVLTHALTGSGRVIIDPGAHLAAPHAAVANFAQAAAAFGGAASTPSHFAVPVHQPAAVIAVAPHR